MPILDQFGNPVKAKELKTPERREIAAVSINDRWSMYPSGGLTPERLAAIFREADNGDVYRQSELFEEMEEKDTHLSGDLLKRKNAVNSIDFDVLPYEEGARTPEHRNKKGVKADKVTDFCREAIFSMTEFEDGLFDLLDAIGKGFALSELAWDASSGQAWVTGMKWVHQKRLDFTDSLTPKLFSADDLVSRDIPPFKVIYHRHKARSGYDTRAGMLRVCAWMYLFKNYAIKDWVRFAEVFGMPLRVGKYDQGAAKEDKEALVAAIQSLGSDAAGIISKSTEIEFVEGIKGSTKENVFHVLGGFCNGEISKAIIGSTLTTEVGDTGSYAASKTHNEVRLDLVKSDAWSLANTVRMQLLRPLVGFNFGWDVPVPWFRFQLQEPEDLKELSEVYKNLVEMGQPVAAEHVSDRFGVPLPEEGQTIIAPRASGGPPGPGAFKRTAAKSGDPAQERFSQSTVDQTSFEAAKAATDAISGLLEPAIDQIQGARSLEEAGEMLYSLYPRLDPGRFPELLGRALFAAGLTGYAASRQDQEE